MKEDNRKNIIYAFYTMKAISESPDTNQSWQGLLKESMEKLKIVMDTEPVESTESSEE